MNKSAVFEMELWLSKRFGPGPSSVTLRAEAFRSYPEDRGASEPVQRHELKI